MFDECAGADRLNGVILFSALIVFISFNVMAGTTTQADKITELLKKEISVRKIPGLSAVVVDQNQLVYLESFGFSDLENRVRVKNTTSYRLASVSKTLTAVLTMKLVENGVLDLEARVEKYCSEFPKKPWPITVRQLLSHQSGIRHYNEKEETHFDPRHFANIQEGLSLFKNDPLQHEPGTDFTYSTYGYSLLGCVLEKVSGKDFRELLKTLLTGPLEMTDTRDDNIFDLVPNRSQGYKLNAVGQLKNSGLSDASYKVPGGGILSTATDLAKYAIALLRNSFIKEKTRTLMFTEQLPSSQIPTGYGLGWSVSAYEKEVWHTGSQERVSTLIYLVPDRGFAVVLLSNLEGNILLPIAQAIREIK